MRQWIVTMCLCALTMVKVCAVGLSPNATISLLTFAPGSEIYSAFGHSAIRVQDEELGLDVAFNYGTFDFDTPNFYGKFISGLTYYKLSVDNTQGLLLNYASERRGVHEQVLNLSDDEKQRIWQSLVENMKPENLTYLYNFVYDNCATRPMQIVTSGLSCDVVFADKKCEASFRDLIENHVGKTSWSKFGIDLLIGAEADKIADFKTRMFLPEEVKANFAHAKKANGEPLVSESRVLVPDFEPVNWDDMLDPMWFTSLLLIVVIVLTIIFGRYLRVFDFVIYALFGIVGILILYLSCVSLHPLVHENYNLLWLNPLALFVCVIMWFRRMTKVTAWLELLLALSAMVAVAGYLFLPQKFNIAFLPLMLVVVVRGLNGFWLVVRKRKR